VWDVDVYMKAWVRKSD